eukprot:4297451-Prymnesium_polylepis.1
MLLLTLALDARDHFIRWWWPLGAGLNIDDTSPVVVAQCDGLSSGALTARRLAKCVTASVPSPAVVRPALEKELCVDRKILAARVCLCKASLGASIARVGVLLGALPSIVQPAKADGDKLRAQLHVDALATKSLPED